MLVQYKRVFMIAIRTDTVHIQTIRRAADVGQMLLKTCTSTTSMIAMTVPLQRAETNSARACSRSSHMCIHVHCFSARTREHCTLHGTNVRYVHNIHGVTMRISSAFASKIDEGRPRDGPLLLS